MKRLGLTFVTGLLLAWTSVAAYGQNALVAQPASVVQDTLPTGLLWDDTEKTSQAAASPEPSRPRTPGPSAGEIMDAAIAGQACLDCPDTPAPKPWKMPQPCCFQRLGIDMGGWIQQGITFNGDKPPDKFNGPNATNDRDREYQLNQGWLYFVRPTKTDGCGWDIGGRVDVAYGTDWRFGQSFGLENRFDDSNSFYGLILPQFYMEVAYNNLTVKMGHFATFTSYEVVPAPMNFFYSHAYLMTGYFDPVLVTGAQAEYKLSDHWTAIGGFNRGWQEFEDPSDTLNFLGGVKWASEDKRSTLSVMVDAGPQIGFTGVHDRTSVYLVLALPLGERLTYASDVVLGRESHGSFVSPGDDADWFGIEQLITYKLNQKWSLGFRYEWVRDEDGARIAGIGNALLTDRGWDGLPGLTGSFHDLSLGLNYRPHPNWVFRPELRWDWYSGEPNPFGQLPYDSHTRNQQLTAAMDLMVTF